MRRRLRRPSPLDARRLGAAFVALILRVPWRGNAAGTVITANRDAARALVAAGVASVVELELCDEAG